MPMEDLANQTRVALYSRVIARVCDRFRQENSSHNELALEFEQKWKNRVTCYTGLSLDQIIEESKEIHRKASTAPVNILANVDRASIDPLQPPETAIQLPMGTPSPTMAAPLSIKGSRRPISMLSQVLMASKKRKLNQSDGPLENGDKDLDEWLFNSDEDEEELKALEEDSKEDNQDKNASQADILISSPKKKLTIVSPKDLYPVSRSSISSFVCHLSAKNVNFAFKGGNRQCWTGRLRNIILTVPRFLEPGESILPGQLLWVYHDKQKIHIHEGEGEEKDEEQSILTTFTNILGSIVEVVSLGTNVDDIVVRTSSGPTTIVKRDNIRRLQEYFVQKGTVKLKAFH